MNVSDEALWSSLSAIIVGVILTLAGKWVSKSNQEDQQQENRRTAFNAAVQHELEDVRDETKKYKEESDQYRQKYFEALERLHAGGSVKEVVDTLKKIDADVQRVNLLLAQHLRDGVYLLEQGIQHDQQVIDAFASIGIYLPPTDYQKDKALGAKQLLDQLEKDDALEEKGEA
jgi:hypothetical protein